MASKKYIKLNADANAQQKNENKKKGIPAKAVIIAVVIVICIVVGILIATGTIGKKPAETSGENIEVTSVEVEPVEGTSEEAATDVFTQELNGENDAALAELAGENVYEDSAAMLQGDIEIEPIGMDVAEDDDTVVVEFKDGKVYRGEAAEEYNNMLAVYLFSGYDEEDVSQQLLTETLENLVAQKVMMAHAEEMGLTKLSDEERKAAEESAEAEYNEQVAYMLEYTDEGLSDEEAQQQAKEMLEEYEGITYDMIYQQTVEGVWEEKLFDELTKDITISEEDVQSAYNDQLALQEHSFNESRENYELTQSCGEVVVFNLDGYRAVKMININMDEDAELYRMELQELMSESSDGENDEIIAEMQANMETCYTDCEALAQQALDELKGGADFETVRMKYDSDAEYTEELLKKTGYYISKDSVLYEEDVIAAAMAAAKPGDYTEVVRTATGACVMQYVGEVQPGAVAYETVHDDLAAQTLDETKENAYYEKCSEWVEEASPVYYEDRMY